MDEEKHEGHELHSHTSKKKSSLTKKVRENPWIISSFVLAILVVIIVISSFGGSMTGKVISEKQAGENLVDYLSSVGYSGFEVSNVESIGSIYLINTTYQGSEVPFYITKEGYVVGNSLISIVPEDSSEEKIPELENPTAELYIWSYCPYGVTALGPFADVASLLGDYADFKVHLYYAGHGDFEEQQNKIQACIQELDYEDEYWNYAKTFADEIYENCYGDADCDKIESINLMDSLGIDSDAVMACVDSQGDALLDEHYNAAKDAGVTGSPTLIVNGIKVSVSRTAEAFKGAVCSGFSSVPEECGQELDSTGTTASGSC